jgi:medium-chain acyl-[acyl-carrier-protein] hydrolase
MRTLVGALASAVTSYLDLPFIFFGHSLGARVAFALAEKLRSQNRPTPLLLVVSASLPPQKCIARDVSAMSDAEFRGYLEELGGTPPEALADRELMELLLPMLRADFLLASELIAPSGLLDSAILALGGLEDAEVSRADLEAWRSATRGPFHLQIFPGGHFYLHGAEQAIIAGLLSVSEQLSASTR